MVNPFDFSDLTKITGKLDSAKLAKGGFELGRRWKANSTYNDLVQRYGPEVAEAAANAVRQGGKTDSIIARAEQQLAERAARAEMIRNPPPVHGSARWIKPAELGPVLQPREAVHNPRSLILGAVPDETGRLAGFVHWDEEGHLLTLAPSGAGKAWTTIIPNLLRYQGAVIVHDPKGELYEETSDWRATLGPVYRINPYNVGTHSNKARFPQHGFNPVLAVQTYADARELAGRLFPPDPRAPSFFIEDAVAFMAPLIWYVRTCLPVAFCNLYTVCRFMAGGADKLRAEVLPQLVRTGRPELVDAADALQTKYTGKGSELASFFSTVNSKLAFWRDPELANCTARNDVDFGALKRGSGVPGQTVTIYVTLPFKLMATSAPFLKMLFVSALTAMEEGQRPDIPVLFMMDEFLQLGPFPEFAAALRTHRGYGVRLWFFLQELGELQRIYPDNGWQAFFNTSAKQFFGINDYNTAELVSRFLSTETRVLRNTTESANVSAQFGRETGSASVNFSTGESISLHGRPLLMPNEVTERLAAWRPDGTRRGIVQLSSLAQLPIDVQLGTYKQSELLMKRAKPLIVERGGYPS